MRRNSQALVSVAVGTVLGALGCASASAQQSTSTSTQRPPDKPPIAQGWIDIATFNSPGMPGGMAGMMGSMGGGGGGAGDMPLSALFGGKSKGNQFGQTKWGGQGSYVDVTVRTSRNPNLTEALQAVPEGTKLAPTLQLKVLPQAKPLPPERGGEEPVEPAEPPKARIKLYWGCGTTVRAGQPKVLDFETATVSQLGEIFRGRRATQRGTHSAPGRPVWPNLEDKRAVPQGSSFVGQHTITGQGVPESFKFNLPSPQDIMPPIALQQAQVDGVTQLRWPAVPHARAYFIAAMGGKGDQSGAAEMTLWTSSELPDSGFGLVDYQTNKSVDQWLKDKVLLAPTTTSCDIPKGVFGEGESMGGMLRMIAYGTELNLAYPPRPTDPKIQYEPDWALKIRVKSVAMAMLGMPSMDGSDGGMGADEAGDATSQPQDPSQPAGEEPKKKKKFGFKDALEAVKDSVGQ